MEMFKNIMFRMIAVFTATGLGVVGAGAIAGVPVYKAVFIAGVGGVASVLEKLARAYLDDGKITKAEVEEAFDAVDKKFSKPKKQAE